eukprot:6079856-Prymnesium_polylepis.1
MQVGPRAVVNRRVGPLARMRQGDTRIDEREVGVDERRPRAKVAERVIALGLGLQPAGMRAGVHGGVDAPAGQLVARASRLGPERIAGAAADTERAVAGGAVDALHAAAGAALFVEEAYESRVRRVVGDRRIGAALVAIRERSHALRAGEDVARHEAAAARVVEPVAVDHATRPPSVPRRRLKPDVILVEAVAHVHHQVAQHAVALPLDLDPEALHIVHYIALEFDVVHAVQLDARVETVGDRRLPNGDAHSVRLPIESRPPLMLLRTHIDTAARRPAALAAAAEERTADVRARLRRVHLSCRRALARLLHQVGRHAILLREGAGAGIGGLVHPLDDDVVHAAIGRAQQRHLRREEWMRVRAEPRRVGEATVLEE